MKFSIVLLFCLVAAAIAAPQDADHDEHDAQILRQEVENNGVDKYNFASETSDGSNVQAEGELKNVGTEVEALAVRGSYSFVADDGQTYTVTYVADENGFQPQGAHLPVAPEA
ncbi:larval cuticle protein 65Ag1-like isoform X2 [Musca vetustissima]|uniref:larval cuticle protein 65Ag1-like isoform X2 n=1 Tax=Musca vetustissima TaxID=27455 RepID=UPI002AB7C497|nr:larval cuticle protein 65Ag1-like isoform X2 [Musca vetustissima]